MSAPKDNLNARKCGAGIQITFYIGSEETAAIRRLLTRSLKREPTKAEMLKYAREQAKNGIYNAVKGELPAIIV